LTPLPRASRKLFLETACLLAEVADAAANEPTASPTPLPGPRRRAQKPTRARGGKASLRR
jgi:hypothetical protein